MGVEKPTGSAVFSVGVAFSWEDFYDMNKRCHRFLCAFFALVIFVSAAVPVSAFAQKPGVSSSETLTTEDAQQMQQADEAVTALTESDEYTAMTLEERQDAALEQLDELADKGLINARSICVDSENGMISFAYTCGVWGGILLNDLDDENVFSAPLDTNKLTVSPLSTQPRSRELGTAMIYYAFDNTVNSSRYPYYSYMKGFWSALGMDTRLDTTVTVSDLKKMGQYDLCILSAHGAYYTYSYGLLWKRITTQPVILLTEEAAPYKDLRYSIDLLCHRIIKINGLYSVTPDFFRSAYFFKPMDGTIVLSETCEFGGTNSSPDSSMADALLAAGASAVVGYTNNVYTVYSRSMLWDTVNQLLLGENIQSALQHAMDTYGEDDLVWYRAQGGRRPHAAAAYPTIYGDSESKLHITLLEPSEQVAA